MTLAIILAAGRGSRLAPLTDAVPKCMVSFLGKPLFEWQLAALNQAGITEIHAVTGYRSQAFAQYGVTEWHNPEWDRTNMVASLMCGRALLENLTEEILILYSDLIYEPGLIRKMSADASELGVMVDRDWLNLWALRMDNPLDDAETLDYADDGTLRDIGRKPDDLSQVHAQFIGIMKLTPNSARAMLTFWDAADEMPDWALGKSKSNAYMTDMIRGMIDAGYKWTTVFTQNGWLEVDTIEDLERYEAHIQQGLEPTIIELKMMEMSWT